MAKIKKICRVCGKEYEACMSKRKPGVFFWQEVACSKECGIEYLRMVDAARADTQDASVGEENKDRFVDDTKENLRGRDSQRTVSTA